MTFSQAIMQVLSDTKLVSSDLSAHNKMQRKGAPTFDQVEVAWHDALVVPGVVLRPARSRRGAVGRGRYSGRRAHPWATPPPRTTRVLARRSPLMQPDNSPPCSVTIDM